MSHSNRIVGARGVSPLAFDNTDNRISIGTGVDFGGWRLDAMAGYFIREGRNVDASEALVIPGHYESGGGIVLLGATWRL